jgi:hypothetical protein
MSQALMDWVTARHDAILAVLEMLTAEHQLSDEHSSALAVTYAEREMDRAAARLADAADALPLDRKPSGWNDPPAVAGVISAARTRFVKAALRVLAAEYADESADADAGAEYADEQLCLAARNLAADAEVARTAKAETAGRLL